MSRFFVELSLELNQKLELPIEVVRHINVLRIRITDTIILFNNSGYDYTAKLNLIEKRQALCTIINVTQITNESSIKSHLLMSMIVNDKFDLVIQKSVELGVTEFTPIITQNTQRLNKEKLANKFEHWQKIIISASEQCGRSILMKLNQPEIFSTVIKQPFDGIKLILSPHHAGQLPDTTNQISNVNIIIGPEGGLTQDEIICANSNGFNSIALGNRILRAETAALTAISLIQYKYGDF